MTVHETVPCADERIRTFGLLLEAHTRLTQLLDAELQRSDGVSLQTFEVLLRISRAPDGVITMTYAQVAEKLHGAQNAETLADAGSLISAVTDEQQRQELGAIYDQRAAELAA